MDCLILVLLLLLFGVMVGDAERKFHGKLLTDGKILHAQVLVVPETGGLGCLFFPLLEV